MFDLSLTENSLHDDLEDGFVDLEALSLGRVEAFLRQDFALANKHDSDFRDLPL